MCRFARSLHCFPSISGLPGCERREQREENQHPGMMETRLGAGIRSLARRMTTWVSAGISHPETFLDFSPRRCCSPPRGSTLETDSLALKLDFPRVERGESLRLSNDYVRRHHDGECDEHEPRQKETRRDCGRASSAARRQARSRRWRAGIHSVSAAPAVTARRVTRPPSAFPRQVQ